MKKILTILFAFSLIAFVGSVSATSFPLEETKTELVAPSYDVPFELVEAFEMPKHFEASEVTYCLSAFETSFNNSLSNSDLLSRSISNSYFKPINLIDMNDQLDIVIIGNSRSGKSAALLLVLESLQDKNILFVDAKSLSEPEPIPCISPNYDVLATQSVMPVSTRSKSKSKNKRWQPNKKFNHYS